MSEVYKARDILNGNKYNITQKMRALFYLRNINTIESVLIIISAFHNESVLLKHELAYVLGQMRNPSCIDTLKNVLRNTEENEIVRHECAEALGNFLDKKNIEFLKSFYEDASIPVRETCYLAVRKIENHHQLNNKIEVETNENSINEYSVDDFVKFDKIEISEFDSYDPAYPLIIDDYILESIYLYHRDIYFRYGAMFSLRNKKNVDVLVKGFIDPSALFRHEVAFVLGQLRMKESIPHLKTVLADENEHDMVRHECAEAIGAIGTDECYEILKEYLQCDADIVRESAEVALDICVYEMSNDAEYCRV
ncbi:deoxyhypusine hydroxylase [Hamiltosporidium tvaerminnensis]|uniref:Deoxyhypusine hydroxylase n=1 Tax=Hamiltosporidium tvaerminnensis TaxID=1176355 RepID=A0A4Q9L862_9MICR|nr:hypothetical protein LUQ84_002624 [Hamiltosporidium tvaerminnensis]TBU03903.1 deoxyhypusine hydroxylase [Hamiltosporidium tvaerminnensis]